jgi:O-antigen/teichoic acid export membrane protein
MRSHELWALGDQAIVSGSNFVTGIVVGRSFGLHDFSLFTLIWMFVLFVQSLGSALVIAPMLSIGPKHTNEQRSAYFGAVFLHQTSFVVVSTVIVAAILRLPPRLLPDARLSEFTLPLVFCLVTQLLQDFLRRYLFLLGKVAPAIVLDAVSYVGRFGAIALLPSFSAMSMTGALWAIGVTSGAAVLLGLAFVERPTWDRRVIGETTRRHWKFASWLAGSAVMQWTSWNLYVIAAPYYLGAPAVGVLRAGQNILGPANVWLQGLENVVPSRASKLLHAEGLNSMKRYLVNVEIWCALVTLPLVVAVNVRPEWLLSSLYGSSFAQGEGALRVYSVVTLLMFVGLPLKVALRSFEHTRPIFVAYVLMTLFAVVTAVPFIKLGGLNGALVGILSVHAVYQGMLAVAVYRRGVLHARQERPVLAVGQE